MRVLVLLLCSLIGILLIPGVSYAQADQDTTVSSDTTKAAQIINDIKESKISRKIIGSITRSGGGDDPSNTVRSEEAFMPYRGKIIRKIIIRHVDFQRTLYDTARNIRNTLTRLGERLHSTSKDWVIRDHLFVRENREVNPWKLADNERYLRDLDFLMDAKFYVIPLSSPDSVDLVVLTRDVFSLGGTVNPANPSKMRMRLYDANLGGWGQRLQFNSIIQGERDPNFVYEFLYRKNSIAGTFINGTVGYTQLNTGSSYGEEDEKAYYIRFDRPLVSPYTRFAGGMELSRNWSENFFHANDSIFRDYRYVINDFWIGYNIGANRNFGNRSRHFVAVRAFDQHFTRVPWQPWEQQRTLYQDQSFILGSATFFKRNFYTARYIYGFGRTEDVPYGHNASVIFGWTRQEGVERPYVGMEAEKSMVSRLGEFYTVGVRAGGFMNDGLEDATLMLSGALTSRLIPRGDFLLRQSIQVDYTRVYKQRNSIPLDINNEFGLQYFRADSLWGTKRFNLHSETIAFSPWKLLGFRFAPFAFGEMAMISGNEESIFDKPFFGFGGGVRTRNENLIFGTVELRMIYYPRTVEDISRFNIRVTTNLKVKYSAGFVRLPGFVRYN